MADLSQAWSIDNLRQAWRWIRSNPDRAYKAYFRELYSAYAVADESLLKHLSDRLDRDVFVASDSCKILFPKPSGILRPITLLSIEDQIVYQAMTNVVAEKLSRHVRSRYNKQVFGHLYAGSSSIWFYKKWSIGYQAFNKAAEQAFNNGYVWTASFDLTAFYDSIDYSVLKHMLGKIGIEHDFSECLTSFLTKWTATKTQIYHNHGIPQGPMSSGLIAEAVLKHFDDQKISRHDVKYFRYVDDIRLFAKKEIHLRHALVELDKLSKDVGLFPQSGKIDIHIVKNIEDELKSISSPVEPILSAKLVDQNALRKRIIELTPRFTVSNPTRFKFLLSRATASATLMDRLWRIYENAPHFYPQLCAHLSKFKNIPDRHADRLIREIEAQEIYPAIRAAFIHSCKNNLPPSQLPKAKLLFKSLWKPLQNQADLSAALWDWLSNQNHFTNAQLKYTFKKTQTEWLGTRVHFGANWLALDKNLSKSTINQSLRSSYPDVAISSAWFSGALGLKPDTPIKSINPHAKLILKELGLIRRAGASVCGIEIAMKEMANRNNGVDWKKFFGKSYSRAERQIISAKAYFKTDPSAWVNAMDVFNDLLLDALYKKDTSLGTYNLGGIGSVKGSTKLKATYPKVSESINKFHEKRLESELSHAIVKATKKATGPIKFKWLNSGAKLIRQVNSELKTKGY
jgi:hypothetical protein